MKCPLYIEIWYFPVYVDTHNNSDGPGEHVCIIQYVVKQSGFSENRGDFSDHTYFYLGIIISALNVYMYNNDCNPLLTLIIIWYIISGVPWGLSQGIQ